MKIVQAPEKVLSQKAKEVDLSTNSRQGKLTKKFWI